MHPFLSLHTLAVQRGDGLLPEFVTLYKRQAAPPQAATPQAATPQAANAGGKIDRTTKGRLRAQRPPSPGMRAARAPSRG